jgi:hypothetical protein
LKHINQGDLVNVESKLYALRRLEIELLVQYQNLGKAELASATVMLDTGFEMINWLVSFDTNLMKERLMTFFKCNRSSLFMINAILNIEPEVKPSELKSQSSQIHSAIKTTERKIIATIREIASHNIDLACTLCGISREDAFSLRNTELDVVEDWVYANKTRGVLSLKIKDKKDAEQLFNIDRISVASIYLDKLGL